MANSERRSDKKAANALAIAQRKVTAASKKCPIRDLRKTSFAPRAQLYNQSMRSRPGENKYCRLADLTNEASVESFFLLRLLKDLGYKDDEIRTRAC